MQPITFGADTPPTIDLLASSIDDFRARFFRSTDGGVTFVPRQGDLTAFGTQFAPVTLTNIGGDPNWLLCGELGAGVEGVSAAGIYRSLDGGATWKRSWAPPAGADFFQPESAATDPTSHGRTFVGASWTAGPALTGAVLRSRASGAAFDVVLDGLAFPQVAVGAGGRGQRRGVVYAGGPSPGGREGLWRSLDHGTTWERLTRGLPTAGNHSVGGVVADPRVRGRVWVAIAGLPWVSFDDGDTWTRETVAGLPYGAQLLFSGPLALDPGVAGERPARLWAMTNLGLFSLVVEAAP